MIRVLKSTALPKSFWTCFKDLAKREIIIIGWTRRCLAGPILSFLAFKEPCHHFEYSYFEIRSIWWLKMTNHWWTRRMVNRKTWQNSLIVTLVSTLVVTFTSCLQSKASLLNAAAWITDVDSSYDTTIDHLTSSRLDFSQTSCRFSTRWPA